MSNNSEMKQKDPPIVLVKTWVSLLTSSHDKQVKDRAKEMLINAFGDIKSVASFCAKNNINIK